MTKRLAAAIGLAAILTGGTAIAVAQSAAEPAGMQRGPRGGPGGGHGPRLGDLGLRGLDLTEAQRDQVRSITESHKAELDQVRTQLRDAHRGLQQAGDAQVIDEAAVRAAAGAVATALASDAILQAKVRAEMLGILSAEQQQQLADRRAEREKRLQQRQQKPRPGRPQGQ